MKGHNPRRRVTMARTAEWHGTEFSHQGLRILARMIARRHLAKGATSKVSEDTSAEVKSHREGKIVETDGNEYLWL